MGVRRKECEFQFILIVSLGDEMSTGYAVVNTSTKQNKQINNFHHAAFPSHLTTSHHCHCRMFYLHPSPLLLIYCTFASHRIHPISSHPINLYSLSHSMKREEKGREGKGKKTKETNKRDRGTQLDLFSISFPNTRKQNKREPQNQLLAWGQGSDRKRGQPWSSGRSQ